MKTFFISVAFATAAILFCAYPPSKPKLESNKALHRQSTLAKRVEAPWHCIVDQKTRLMPYMCFKSTVVSMHVFLSVHCFWGTCNDGPLSVQHLTVVVGKVYRVCDENKDKHAKKSVVIGWGKTEPVGELSKSNCYVPTQESSRQNNCSDCVLTGDSSGRLVFLKLTQTVARYYLNSVISGGIFAGTAELLRSAYTAITKGVCTLPPYPTHGRYDVEVEGSENPTPSKTLDYVSLTYSCARGYGILGSKRRFCVQGVCSENGPKCVPAKIFLPREFSDTKDACILPPYPKNGLYTVKGVEDASPGQAFDYIALNYSCSHGYRLVGREDRLCVKGVWAEDAPTCAPTCKLVKHPSVIYTCSDGSNIRRLCRDFEPDGSIVTPMCRTPYYNTPVNQNFPMRCIGGRWNYIATCDPDCGRLPEQNGHPGSPFVVPWIAGVYKKRAESYHHVCGGTLISQNAVVSSAQCFWNPVHNVPEPAWIYAVALGKLHRDWNNTDDKFAQKLEIADVKLPPLYRDAASNYQDDIAVLLLATNSVYTRYVRPVCLNMVNQFEREQFQAQRLGMIASWSIDLLTSVNRVNESSNLRVLYLPYVPLQECLTRADTSLIGSNTFCAGFENGTALCRFNSGVGIAFPTVVKGVVRYFFHGVSSACTTDGGLCCASSIYTFTQVSSHELFLMKSIGL